MPKEGLKLFQTVLKAGRLVLSNLFMLAVSKIDLGTIHLGRSLVGNFKERMCI